MIKCIDPNEGEALKRGWEGEGGREGEGGGRREGGREGWAEGAEGNFTWGVELIKCIDPNEGEALRRGSTFKSGGLAPPTPHLFHRLWGREGGYRLIISVSWLSVTDTRTCDVTFPVTWLILIGLLLHDISDVKWRPP